MHPTLASAASPSSSGAASAAESERRRVDRRRRPTPLLSRYSVLGGRRAGERRGDSCGHYVDRYEPWLVAAMVAIGALCALDAVFTLLYLQNGGSEANPIMARVIEWGPRPFLIVKCLVTNLGLLVLCMHKNFRYVKPVICGLLGVYALLFAYHLWLAAHV